MFKSAIIGIIFLAAVFGILYGLVHLYFKWQDRNDEDRTELRNLTRNMAEAEEDLEWSMKKADRMKSKKKGK